MHPQDAEPTLRSHDGQGEDPHRTAGGQGGKRAFGREQRRQVRRQGKDHHRRGGESGPDRRQGHGERRGAHRGEQRGRRWQQGQRRPPPAPGRLIELRALEPLFASPFDVAALVQANGVVFLRPGDWGELRRPQFDYALRPDDTLAPPDLLRRHAIAQGSFLTGKAAPAAVPGSPPRLILREIETVDGVHPDIPERANRIPFKDLTCIDPLKKFRLAEDTRDPSLRILDLLTPLGKGQRGLIVAPPRTGKTILLQRLARAISENHPEVHLIILLVDERPEEATDWKRSVRGEVLSSTSDEMAASHVAIAELVIERAKRLVELGRDVVILFDSLTRLGRAYNHETRNSGRTLSGGVDARTLEKPKAFFGAARNTEEAGSLTIIATALIETGSRMDEVIFEEFKGTGNMELVLSRKLADLRIFPAVDVHLSGTRKEEKLIPPEDLQQVWDLRRVLQNLDPADGMRLLVRKIEAAETKEQFFRLVRERG